MKLHEELLVLRNKEKQLSVDIIEKLQQMEEGRKYLRLGYSSFFDYLVRGLSYSESAAYQRQSCVRLTKEMPEIKQKIESGALNPTGLRMAYKTLKTKPLAEKRKILQQMENKPAREVKSILSKLELAPPMKIQKSEYQNKVVLRLELSKELNLKFEKLKALMSHQGDAAALLERLIDQGLKKYANTRFKISQSQNARFIPRTLRNHALKKSNYQCQYPGCEASHFLQIDHIVPVRKGGRATADNLQVLCGSHNRHKG